jgi:hypothetical protein
VCAGLQRIFGFAWTALNFVTNRGNELFPCLKLFLTEVLGNELEEVCFVVIVPQKALPVTRQLG